MDHSRAGRPQASSCGARTLTGTHASAQLSAAASDAVCTAALAPERPAVRGMGTSKRGTGRSRFSKNGSGCDRLCGSFAELYEDKMNRKASPACVAAPLQRRPPPPREKPPAHCRLGQALPARWPGEDLVGSAEKSSWHLLQRFCGRVFTATASGRSIPWQRH
jgi:hypothetical protein